MKSMLVRFKDKNYYVRYDDLLNKAAKNLFAYEDEALAKNVKLNGKTLMFNKKDMEDKLKNNIKMDSPMPGAAKTESKMTNEQKLRKYIREMIIEALKEDAPYGQPDEDKYLFKTGQDYLAGIQGDSSMDEAVEEPSAEDLTAKEKAAKEAQRKQAYKRFFSQALAKFGYSSPASIPDDKKKSFYDYIDANWTSKQEAPLEETTGAEKISIDNIEVDDIIIDKEGHKFRVDKNDNNNIEIVDLGTTEEYSLNKKYIPRYIVSIEKASNKIRETSNSGGVAGYETPMAFTGKKGISKKQKSIANQLGYELVDKSYAVKDQGDTQDLKEAQFYSNTDEAYIQNEIIKILSSNAVADSKYDNEIDFGQKTDKVLHEDDFDVVANHIIELLKKNPDARLNEGLDSYYFKDDTLTNEQKLGLSIRTIRNTLMEVERLVQKSIKLKSENNIDTDKMGKRIYSALRRINEKTVRLMVALNDLK